MTTKSKRKPRIRRVLTGIWYDEFGSMGCTAEEQRDKDIKFFEEGVFDEKIKLDWYNITKPSDFKRGTELLLFDYGGMGFGSSVGELGLDMSRRMLEIAQENPKCLIVVTSSFTYDHAIHPLLNEIGLATLPNVREQFPGNREDERIPAWWLEKRDPSPAEFVGSCGRCQGLLDRDRHGYSKHEHPTGHPCVSCHTLVCCGCYDDQKSKCGDCAKW